MNAPCYSGGEQIRLGDIVSIGQAVFGRIVCLAGRDECCEDVPKEAMNDCDSGYVIQTAEGAWLHCSDESEMALVDRAD
jgi:hypothetical protein